MKTGNEICGVEDKRGLCVHTNVEPRGFDCYCKEGAWAGESCDMEAVRGMRKKSRMNVFCSF